MPHVIKVDLSKMSLKELELLKVEVKYSDALNKEGALVTIEKVIKELEGGKKNLISFKETKASKMLDKYLYENGSQSCILLNKNARLAGLRFFNVFSVKCLTANELMMILSQMKPNTPITFESEEGKVWGLIDGITIVEVNKEAVENGDSNYTTSQIVLKTGAM